MSPEEQEVPDSSGVYPILRAETQYDSVLLRSMAILKLAANSNYGADLLNRVIKLAIDQDGKENEAAKLLVQAFDEGGEEACVIF